MIEVVITAILVWECVYGGGRELLATCVGFYFGGEKAGEKAVADYMNGSPKELDPVKSYAILAASVAYLVRVSIWTTFVQHTDSTNFRSLFLIFWYHLALHCSQPVMHHTK